MIGYFEYYSKMELTEVEPIEGFQLHHSFLSTFGDSPHSLVKGFYCVNEVFTFDFSTFL